MRIAFTKMNGAGNDFVLIDNRSQFLQLNREQVRCLCNRQRGVGADGLLILEPNPKGTADWSWQFFNSDGGTGDMCGNGARCFAAFIRHLTGHTSPITFETLAGIIQASFADNLVTVTLTPPEQLQLDQSLELNGTTLTAHSLNTGVPHAVVFVEDADEAMVLERGRAIRRHQHFGPAGTNVNFVEVVQPDQIRVRTYERGVEGETLACGTGVSAAAMIASHLKRILPPVAVKVQGGDILTVDFKATESGFEDVRLTGPAEIVFTGEIEV
ncbi:MAG: Diaminopimelate epimerase [Verrucomicrobia subdivision 3 bacterium]|nr:Diaminopimelate epimerase [Limisphaerales bacterium]MCS1413027.1 Diaminopimelate epimerase [Limisphaerales bacterium]